jgi:hypothetical protein
MTGFDEGNGDTEKEMLHTHPEKLRNDHIPAVKELRQIQKQEGSSALQSHPRTVREAACAIREVAASYKVREPNLQQISRHKLSFVSKRHHALSRPPLLNSCQNNHNGR